MKAQVVLAFSMFALAVHGQGWQESGMEHPWEQYLNEVLTVDEMESASLETTYDLLCELEQQPLDINMVTREQLEELPFLSAHQVEEIMEYRYRHGRIESMGELLMIRSLDYRQRRLLTCFLYIGEESTPKFPDMKQIVRYGKQELTASARVPFYERKGDRNGYLGYPYKHWMRYQFTYGDNIKIGVVGAQDAGEPFFTDRNKLGYDYYSLFLQVRQWGRVESLVVGNYRVALGMGLVINNSFGLGKVAMLQNLGRTTSNVRAHSSRSGNYLQGTAATVRVTDHLRAMAFLSYRPIDATLNKDSTVSTILASDYHRTEKEMGKKHNLHQTAVGGSLRYDHDGLHAGLNVLALRYDRELRPDISVLYRRHYPRGRSLLNMGVDYQFVRRKVALQGETAVDKKGHLATINSMSLQLSDRLSVMALQRFYAYRYTSTTAQSYSDGGRVQNESGVYLGVSWQPTSVCLLTAYSDIAYFAWARYRASQSSYTWDHLLQGTWRQRDWTFGARYRLRLRQQDSKENSALENRWEHRGRLSAEYAFAENLSCRTQLDGCYCPHDREWGAMLSSNISYRYHWLRLNAGLDYFHTDSYDSRVYLYEQGPLYTYSIYQYDGEGIRYWLMLRVQLGKKIMLTAKAGVSDYFDRCAIGSGYQQIDASSITDLDLQVRWKI